MCWGHTAGSPPRRRRRSSYRSARSPPVSHKRKSRAKGQGSTGKPTNGQYASSANFILSSGNCVRQPVLLPGGDSDFPVFLYYNRYFCKYLQYSVNFISSVRCENRCFGLQSAVLRQPASVRTAGLFRTALQQILRGAENADFAAFIGQPPLEIGGVRLAERTVGRQLD